MDFNLKTIENIEKPGRYSGGEWNSVRKEITPETLRVAFAFPDTYEIGMSHLGMKILYGVINQRPDMYCERVFAPWIDYEAKLIADNQSLCTLETGTPLNEFDFLFFTLQYELSYANVLNIMKLSGIPVWSKDRDNTHPIVIAGGPCACNPEPLAGFIDAFLLGEGETGVLELLDLYKQGKDKQTFLNALSWLDGMYVPANGKTHVRKRIEPDFENAYYPTSPVVPNIGVVHDRVSLEIMRGCTRGCRFCQAGYIYRPLRERSLEKLLHQANDTIKNTGYDEVSLMSLSSGDYTGLSSLIPDMMRQFGCGHVSVALPSLRVDSFEKAYIRDMPSVRKSGLTFAPEAGTQRLRDVINKNVTEEQLLNSVKTAFELGWNSVKLYFMIGLPTETYEDLDGIAEMVRHVADEYYSVDKKQRKPGLKITVSTSSFVPKPHTPFQWCAQDSMEELADKQKYLKNKLNMRYAVYNWHHNESSMLEAVFARGGRELCNVLYEAHKAGCRLDSWSECFDYKAWVSAFEACGISPQKCAAREISLEDELPWAHIDYLISNEYLKTEYTKALKGITTGDCRAGCLGCGLQLECSKGVIEYN